MSRRTLLLHTIFCAIAAGLAFIATQERTTTSSDDEAITLLDFKIEELGAARYTWPDGDAGFARDSLGGWRVELEHSPPGSQPGDERERFVFPAGRAAVRSLEKTAPFQAERALGELSEDKLSVMGLSPPERSLELKVKDKSYIYEVGVTTPGKRSRYLRAQGSKIVYLVDNGAVSGFEGNPARLQETRVLNAEIEDVAELTVERGTARAEIVHMLREQAKDRYFAKKGAEADRSEEAGEMFQALRSLRVTRYVDDSELASATVEASWRVTLGDETVREIAILRRVEPLGWFVRSGEWAATVAETRAQRTLDDVDSLFSSN